jgi:hypothetical protein
MDELSDWLDEEEQENAPQENPSSAQNDGTPKTPEEPLSLNKLFLEEATGSSHPLSEETHHTVTHTSNTLSRSAFATSECALDSVNITEGREAQVPCGVGSSQGSSDSLEPSNRCELHVKKEQTNVTEGQICISNECN